MPTGQQPIGGKRRTRFPASRREHEAEETWYVIYHILASPGIVKRELVRGQGWYMRVLLKAVSDVRDTAPLVLIRYDTPTITLTGRTAFSILRPSSALSSLREAGSFRELRWAGIVRGGDPLGPATCRPKVSVVREMW